MTDADKPSVATAAGSPTASSLMGAIEAEIIPRLVVAYSERSITMGDAEDVGISDDDVHAFTDTVLAPESAAYAAIVQAIRDRGASVESIYLQLLAPAARSLGPMWSSDTCDFMRITIALWRMQQAMYDLSPAFHAGSEQLAATNKNIMLTPLPGSQHTFGIQMLAEFFQRAGWGTWCEPACDNARVLSQLRDQWFDVAGVSVGSTAQLPSLHQWIEELRNASQNKSMAVLVGGPVFAEDPSLADAFDVNGTAVDAIGALEKAERLISLRLPKTHHPKVLHVS